MGMFDTIKYEGKDYQTKNFDCDMGIYKIENERLLLDCGHYIETPLEELPNANFP